MIAEMDRDVNQQENKEQPPANPRLRRLKNLKKSQAPDTFSTSDHIYFINGAVRECCCRVPSWTRTNTRIAGSGDGWSRCSDDTRDDSVVPQRR
jgi:hypothetical protein